MKRDLPRPERCKLALFCTHSEMSLQTLRALIDIDLSPRLVIVPGISDDSKDAARRDVKTASERNKAGKRKLLFQAANAPAQPIDDIAKAHNIIIGKEQLKSPQRLLEYLLSLHINLLVIACFPYKLPALIYQEICSLNIHPSLLPAYKGPSPLFWQLYHNEPSLGISLHFLSQQWDSGKILSQTLVARRHNESETELQQRLAAASAQLLLRALHDDFEPANSAIAESYFSAPGAEDFTLTPSWGAQHAYDFIRATSSWHHVYRYKDENGNIICFSNAISLIDTPSNLAQASAQKEKALIAFRDGAVWVELSETAKL